jgi:hypothetical protein
MKLEVFRQIAYISPSTFMKWKNCEYSVFLQRLAGYPYVREPQGLAAAIGSAFDALVKDVMIKRKGWKSPFTLKGMLKNNVTIEGEQRSIAIEQGRYVAAQYIKSDLFIKLMDCVQEVEREYYANIGGIPILGQLDARVDGMPFDWKLRGFASKNIPSPTKGFNVRYNLATVIEEPMHKERFPLNEKNENWAIQMAMYDLCTKAFMNKYIIHEITPNCMVEHKGNIASNTIKAETLNVPFYRQLLKELTDMWEAIHGQLEYADVPPPDPHEQKCHKWGVICGVAEKCAQYKRIMLNPKRRYLA